MFQPGRGFLRWDLWLRLSLGFLCWPALPSPVQGDSSFWVWNRDTPLRPEERQALSQAGITALYWHFAEIENTDGAWRWKRAPSLPEKPGREPGLRIVPVIRLEASTREPFAGEASTALAGSLATAFRATGADEWQLDYDAPSRLVGAYAGFLRSLQPQAPRLSSTALAGWVRLPAFPALQEAVAELFPMFYDLEPDTASQLRPLLEVDSSRAWLAEWSARCQIPWRAGWPWFARLSVYGADGQAKGHFRQWSWDEVVFRREVTAGEGTRKGLTALPVNAPWTLGKTVLRPGDTLVARWPDLDALAAIAPPGGKEAIYFRLPDGAPASGWSLREFGARHAPPTPGALSLKIENNHLVLCNEGPHDLPPRLAGDGPRDRGYALEVDAPAAVFREALAGEFWRVAGHVQPDAQRPPSVPIANATRLTFWFSALPAGAELRSGWLQLSPGAAWSRLCYRVLNIEPHPAWKPLVSCSP